MARAIEAFSTITNVAQSAYRFCLASIMLDDAPGRVRDTIIGL